MATNYRDTRRKRDNFASFEELMRILDTDVEDWCMEIGESVAAPPELLKAINYTIDGCEYARGILEDEIPADTLLYDICDRVQCYRATLRHRRWNTVELQNKGERPEGPAIFTISRSEAVAAKGAGNFDAWRNYMLHLRDMASAPLAPPARQREQISMTRPSLRPSDDGDGTGFLQGSELYVAQRPHAVATHGAMVMTNRHQPSPIASYTSQDSRTPLFGQSLPVTDSSRRQLDSAMHTNLPIRQSQGHQMQESSDDAPPAMVPGQQARTGKEMSRRKMPEAELSAGEPGSDVTPKKAKSKGPKPEVTESSSDSSPEVDFDSEVESPPSVKKKSRKRSSRGAKTKKEKTKKEGTWAEAAAPAEKKQEDNVFPKLPAAEKPVLSGKAPPAVSFGPGARPGPEEPRYAFGNIVPRRKTAVGNKDKLTLDEQLARFWMHQLQKHDIDKTGLYGVKPSELGPWTVSLPQGINIQQHVTKDMLDVGNILRGLYLVPLKHQLPGNKGSFPTVRITLHPGQAPKTRDYCLQDVRWQQAMFWRGYIIITEWVYSMYVYDKMVPLVDFLNERSVINRNKDYLVREAEYILNSTTEAMEKQHTVQRQISQPEQKVVKTQSAGSKAVSLGQYIPANEAVVASKKKTMDDLKAIWISKKPSPNQATMLAQAKELLADIAFEQPEDDLAKPVAGLVCCLVKLLPKMTLKDENEKITKLGRELMAVVRERQKVVKNILQADMDAGAKAKEPDDDLQAVPSDADSKVLGMTRTKDGTPTADTDTRNELVRRWDNLNEDTMLGQARKLLSRLKEKSREEESKDVATEVQKWIDDVEDGERKFLGGLQDIWALKERFPSLIGTVRESLGDGILSGLDGTSDLAPSALWKPF